MDNLVTLLSGSSSEPKLVVSHRGCGQCVVCYDHLFAAQTLPNECREIIKIRCHHVMTPDPVNFFFLMSLARLSRSSMSEHSRGLIVIVQ